MICPLRFEAYPDKCLKEECAWWIKNKFPILPPIGSEIGASGPFEYIDTSECSICKIAKGKKI